MALALEPLFFRKKLTVIGIIGHTQGVSKARSPPKKHAQNMYHNERSAMSSTSALSPSIAVTGAHSWSWVGDATAESTVPTVATG